MPTISISTDKEYADLYVRRLKNHSTINMTYISVCENTYVAKQITFYLNCRSIISSFINIEYLKIGIAIRKIVSCTK